MFQSILNALIAQVSNPSSPVTGVISKWLLHALGDKTSTIIGIALGYVIAYYADFSSIIPAKYAPYVTTGLGILTAIFAGYVTTPAKGAALVGAVNAEAK